MEQSTLFTVEWIAVAIIWGLPLLSMLLGLSLWKKQGSWFGFFASALLGISAVLSWALFFALKSSPNLYFTVAWWSTGEHTFDFSLALSPNSRLLLIIVNSVSLLVHVFSLEYMKDDPGKNRYFAWLGLFTFSMTGIVLSDSLLLMFCFWEVVGASSYLLIGFWFTRAAAAKASYKAFIVNRIGDLGFLIGLGLLYVIFNTFSIREIQEIINTVQWKGEEFTFSIANASFKASPVLFTVLGICLFGGAVGKSAQFPLQLWLPDAMQGPTPVSALIHAATMVAAGIYFLVQIFFLLTPDALSFIAIIGTLTALMGAVAAIAQYDIKKVLAFSTISQLGFMVMAVGIGGTGESLFHLTTHAAFKAGLFLAAGSVIHALHIYSHHANLSFDVQDIRQMGGLHKLMPVTFITFLVVAMALAGFPLFSGFLSKDAILAKTIAWASAEGGWRWGVPAVAVFTAFLTAFYMARLAILVFFGRSKMPQSGSRHSVKENNRYITVPLILLAAASIWVWFDLNPFAGSSWLVQSVAAGNASLSSLYLEKTMEVSHSTVLTLSILASLAGVSLGYIAYDEETSGIVPAQQQSPIKGRGFFWGISFNNWYLERFYEQTVIYLFWKAKSTAAWLEEKVIDRIVNLLAVVGVVLALIVSWVDRHLIDGLVNFAAALTKFFGNIARSFQGGPVQKYIAWSLFFTLLLVTWILIK